MDEIDKIKFLGTKFILSYRTKCDLNFATSGVLLKSNLGLKMDIEMKSIKKLILELNLLYQIVMSPNKF